MEGITQGNSALLEASLADDAELRCDISFGCPYVSKDVIIATIGTSDSNFGLYINETWQQFSESIEVRLSSYSSGIQVALNTLLSLNSSDIDTSWIGYDA